MFGEWPKYLEAIEKVPGDFAEFGVYQGECTLAIAAAGRRVWAWDTFQGMPDDNYIEQLDNSDPPGKWLPAGDVVKILTESGLDVVPVVGKFSDTIPAWGPEHPDVKFAFVHIDCDHYWAYRRVLEFITPRMSPGGIVRLDDYGCCSGARKATDEWLEATGHKLEGDIIQF